MAHDINSHAIIVAKRKVLVQSESESSEFTKRCLATKAALRVGLELAARVETGSCEIVRGLGPESKGTEAIGTVGEEPLCVTESYSGNKSFTGYWLMCPPGVLTDTKRTLLSSPWIREVTIPICQNGRSFTGLRMRTTSPVFTRFFQ